MEEKDEYPTTQYTPLTRRQRIRESKFGSFYRRHRFLVIAAVMLLLLLPLLGLLALRNRHSARADWVSPTVYPSRESNVYHSAMDPTILIQCSHRLWSGQLVRCLQQSPRHGVQNDSRGNEQHHNRLRQWR